MPPKKHMAWTESDLSRLEARVRVRHSSTEDALQAIIEILRAPEPRSRRGRLLKIMAATTLSMLGPTGQKAAPALRGMLKSGNNDYRQLAALCMAEIGAHAEVMPELITLLRDDSHTTRGSAARAIGRLGKDGLPAVEALSAALSTEIFRTVRADIITALESIKSPLALPALRVALGDSYASIREAAEKAIQVISNTGGIHGKE